MRGKQLKALLEGIGLSSFENIQVPNLNTIIMSQNFYVVPDRDFFTFDFTNKLIKIKQMQKVKKVDGTVEYKPISTHKYDIYFNFGNVVGLEFLHPRSRY